MNQHVMTCPSHLEHLLLSGCLRQVCGVGLKPNLHTPQATWSIEEGIFDEDAWSCRRLSYVCTTCYGPTKLPGSTWKWARMASAMQKSWLPKQIHAAITADNHSSVVWPTSAELFFLLRTYVSESLRLPTSTTARPGTWCPGVQQQGK